MFHADHSTVLLAQGFVVFGVLAALVGIGLLVDARRMHRVFTVANRWISTRLFFERADTPRNIDRLLTRNPRLFGSLVIAGAVYSLYGLFTFHLDNFLLVANAHARYRAFAWGVQVAWWALALGNVGALVIGFMEFVFPSQLERLSKLANRWISSPRLVSEKADRMNMALDTWVGRFPRLFGAAILAGAVVVVFRFVQLLSGNP